MSVYTTASATSAELALPVLSVTSLHVHELRTERGVYAVH
jgi:hypothetical protein